jgi:hypothetical protein
MTNFERFIREITPESLFEDFKNAGYGIRCWRCPASCISPDKKKCAESVLRIEGYCKEQFIKWMNEEEKVKVINPEVLEQDLSRLILYMKENLGDGTSIND